MARWGLATAMLAVFLVSQATPAQDAASSNLQGPAFAPQAFLEETCYKCHNEQAATAMALFSGLFLDRIDVSNVARDPLVWEKVVRKLRTGMMPPSSEPRPDPVAREQFVGYLEAELDRFAAQQPNPGRPALHRLNRQEYANAIRDLLALDVDTETLLPVDDASFGFDNIAGSLGISPVLVERYANAAAEVSQLAVGNMTMSADRETHYVPNFLMQAGHIEGLPFGTRGGLEVEHFFPLDADYLISADLMSAVDGVHIGNGVPDEQLEISIDGERVALFDISDAPRGMPTGDRGEAAPDDSADAAADAAPAADQGGAERWAVSLPVTAGPHRLAASFVKRNFAPIEDIVQQPSNSLLDPLFNGTPEVTLIPHIGSLTVEGPYKATGLGDTPSRARVFSCRPQTPADEAGCARALLIRLATRAYRQAVGTEHLTVLMDFYERGREEGGFERGIQVALQRILASPQFLFRFERDPAGAPVDSPYGISDLELASRLSFFIWSSIPDDELLELATAGRLSRPGVLRSQVERMLADPKASALTENFAGQWLYLRNLDIKDASSILFPDFDDNLRYAFRRETELLFEHIMREDRSVLEFMTADYSFVNERLAKHYGIPDVYGSQFRKVAVTDERRRGILGHGSILLVTSQPNRTSPVTRGVWILENILGAHVPSPPPISIPALEEAAGDKDFASMSVRELMELHRSKPFCEGCHKIMDPVGLAMENYDVIGRWRTIDGGLPLDASARLVDGTDVDGPVELRKALLRYSDQIMRNFTEKMLIYALGRGTEYYDMPVVRSIVAQARADDYRFSSIVMGIATSEPFLRRAPEGWRSPEMASTDH